MNKISYFSLISHWVTLLAQLSRLQTNMKMMLRFSIPFAHPHPINILNIECHAYQLFDHIVTHCTLRPQVLAIPRVHAKNRQQYEVIM